MAQSPERLFNIPGVILAVLVVFVAVHLAREWLPVESANDFTLALAFIPARYTGYVGELPGGHIAQITSLVTHMFVHGDWTHLLINSVWLLAMGGAVASQIGTTRFIVFSTICGIAGALLFLALNWGQLAPMVGASGALSGLMGAVLRIMFSGAGMVQLPDASSDVPVDRMASVREMLRNKQFVTMVLVWMAFNIGLGLTGSLLTPGMGGIAWEAHIGGFAAGIALIGLFSTDRPGPEMDL